MAMKSSSVELFLAGEEENDFGFELLPLEPQDLALSQWELVDPSDADSDSDSDSNRSDPGTDLGSSSPVNHAVPIACRVTAGRAFFLDDNGQWVDRAGSPALVFDQTMLTAAECTAPQAWFHECSRGGVVADDDYEEEDGEDDDDGLDDELVPRNLRGKLGRQRMRKLGKRACSKMNSSKRSPHLYVKSGCVYGKHGLGLKHSLC